VNLRGPLVVFALGVLTFGLVFTLLEFSPSAAAPGQVPAPTPELATATPLPAVAADSIAPRLSASDVAVGVPVGGSEALLRDVQPGDRLDIVAILPSPTDAHPLTTVLVRGATVVKPLTLPDPLLVEVPSSDALLLAHVVLGGTRLGYILWPANTRPVTPPLSIDANTLGLSTPTPVVVPPTPTAIVAATLPPPTPTAVPGPGSGFLYQVQSNDTWDTIASTFGLPVAELRQWNESPGDEPTPGSLVFIPRGS